MKTMIILISVIVLIMYLPLFGTNDSSFFQINKDCFAIQFSISKNFSIDHLQGSFVSAKYHIRQSQAIRIGIDMEVDVSKYENILLGRDRDFFGISINSQYVFYVKRQKVYFYYGLGPNFGYVFYNSRDKQRQIDQAEYHETQKDVVYDYCVGLNTIYGIEIFVITQVSLLAEYGHIYKYSYFKSEDKIMGISERYNHTFESKPVKFGISIYF